MLPGGRARYLPLLTAEANARGLPPEVADAVARVESSYNSAAIGADGERGMMQVMPPTAAMLGFRGSLQELAEPETNIRLGVTYLAHAWRLAKGDL
jgi:soluble lytic murein transglycosylase-like protein